MRKGKAAKTVEEYLANTPEPARSTLTHIRAVIRSVVPKNAIEVISYGMPMFRYNGMLVAYAAFKNHCSLFPTGSGVLDRFEKELAGYRTSKGTIQFPADRPLPDALVKKIVRARVRRTRSGTEGRCYTVGVWFFPLLAKDARNGAPSVGYWRRTVGSSLFASLARRNDKEFLSKSF
jgi:uncharacterized protein YdhG (YjbR/CyaY superfamily)